jgi:hypothetical protein
MTRKACIALFRRFFWECVVHRSFAHSPNGFMEVKGLSCEMAFAGLPPKYENLMVFLETGMC